MSKIVLVLASAGLLILLNGPAAVQAEDMPEGATVASETSQSMNVGNKICPVSGEKINEETKATYEYDGKIYNFCCPMCIEEFKKDPQKYINKVEEELRAESKEKAKDEQTGMETMHESMPSDEGGMHEGHQH